VEFEQKGKERAEYGKRLLEMLSNDLTKRFGRGFSPDNLEAMRNFYLQKEDFRDGVSEIGSSEIRHHVSGFINFFINSALLKTICTFMVSL
jgi:hypothetical protein